MFKTFFLNYPEFANWIITALLSVVSFLITLILGYVITIFKKAGTLNEKIEKNQKELINFRRILNENISQILASQISLSDELSKVRGSLGSATMAIHTEGTKIDKIMDKLDRTNHRVEETTKTLEKSLQLLKVHNTEIIKLKNGLLLLKDKKE